MKKIKYLLPIMALCPTFLQSCSAPHEHSPIVTYSDMTEDFKMTASKTCSTCNEALDSETVTGVWQKTSDATCQAKEKGKYFFDFQRFDYKYSAEMEKGEKLPHNFILEASGEFKTEYYVHEVFDPTGLTLTKKCSYTGCSESTVIEDYEVQYELEGQESFNANDEFVYLVYEDLTCEVPVTVSLLPNEITGLPDEVNTHCLEELSLDGASAVAGELEVEGYYTEAECINPVEADELIDGTYYAKVVSDGLDADHEIAQKVVKMNVTHDLALGRGLIIGYKDNICKKCGEHVASEEELMSDGDCVFETDRDFITLSDEEADDAANAQWPNDSIDAGWVKADLQIDNSLVFAHNGKKIRRALLPQVDYTLFDSVTFVMQNMEAASVKIALGITSGGNELLDLEFRKNYVITATYSDSRLELVAEDFTNNKSTAVPAVIEDEEVINGLEPLAIFHSALEFEDGSCGNQFSLKKILLNHEHTGGTPVPSTEVIGLKDLVCDCGKTIKAGSSEAMTASDVNFKSFLYGASYDEDANTENSVIVVKDYGVKFRTKTEKHAGSNFSTAFRLPKVDYSKYSKVEFELKGEDCGYIIFCSPLSDSTLYVAQNENNGCTIVVTNNAGSYTCSLTGHGSRGDQTVYSNLAIEEEEVISGTKGLVFKVLHNSNADRWCYLESVALTPVA